MLIGLPMGVRGCAVWTAASERGRRVRGSCRMRALLLHTAQSAQRTALVRRPSPAEAQQQLCVMTVGPADTACHRRCINTTPDVCCGSAAPRILSACNASAATDLSLSLSLSLSHLLRRNSALANANSPPRLSRIDNAAITPTGRGLAAGRDRRRRRRGLPLRAAGVDAVGARADRRPDRARDRHGLGERAWGVWRCLCSRITQPAALQPAGRLQRCAARLLWSVGAWLLHCKKTPVSYPSPPPLSPPPPSPLPPT